MKRILLPALLLLLSSFAFATPVGPMNYQGRLLDNNGIPVTGSYNFVVKIYDDPATGTLKYQETKNGLAVDDGVYSFKIGTGPKTGGDSLWDIDLWQQNLNDLYLEVVVNGETLTPRHELTSAPHAFTATLALNANSVAYLGGQTTDNVLVAICKANKGVWLDIADKCLGPGSDFSVAAVGGSVVTLASLHSGTDLTGIDLTNANIAGIDFGSANLSKGVFDKTTYNSNGIKASNLSNSKWENAIDLNSATAVFSGSIQGMSVKGMDLGKWNLSSRDWPDNYLFSAAELSVCPVGVPNASVCMEQYTGSGRFMILGYALNMGHSSALANPDGSLNTNSSIGGLNLQSASFAGATVPLNFDHCWIDGANFAGSILVGNRFIENSRLKNLNLDNARIDGAIFTGEDCCGAPSWSGWSLKNASLNNVMFLPTGANVPNNFNFTGAHLSNVYFPEVTNFNFTDAVLDGISLDVDTSTTGGKDPATNFTFTNAKLTGNLRLDLGSKPTIGCGTHTEYRSSLPGVQVFNAVFLPDPDNTPACSNDDGIAKADFSNCSIVRTEFATNARNSKYTSCTFKEVVVKSNANFTNAVFTTVTGRDDQIWWELGAICPNGSAVTTAGFSTSAGVGCNGKW